MNSPIVEMMDDENAMSRESSNNSQGSKAASLAENNEYNNECQHIYGFKVSTGRVRLLRVYKSFLVVYGVESEAKRTVLDFEFLEDADITELKAYCEAGRFAEFINVVSSKLSTWRAKSLSPITETQYLNVTNAWNVSFEGSAACDLRRYIEDLQEKLSSNSQLIPYTPLIPLSNSSAFGKTKLQYEISKQIIAFCFCIRKPLPPDQLAWPPADTPVLEFLRRAPDPRLDKCVDYMRGFWSSLFHHATTVLPSRCNRNVADIAQFFYKLHDDPDRRSQFYENVVTKATPCNTHELLLSWNNFNNNLSTVIEGWGKKQDSPKRSQEENPKGRGHFVLACMDEIDILLGDANTMPLEHTKYSRMKSALADLSNQPFFVIAASTTTTLATLAPSRELAPSMRERQPDVFQPNPFTELGFDVSLHREPLEPGKLCFNDAGTLELAVKFGRPIWKAMHDVRKATADPKIIYREMRIFAIEKLTNQKWPPIKPRKADDVSMAVLSCRLLLDLSPSTVAAQELEQRLVRSHMRVLYSVGQDRQVIVTGYSSEPILADAAAAVMNYRGPENKTFFSTWQLLETFLSGDLSSKGEVGELIGRVLATLAIDEAIQARSLSNRAEVESLTPIPVAEFFQKYLTDDAWNTLRTSLPANRSELSVTSAEQTFEKAFKNAYILFSHWARASDSGPLTASYLWALWLRGVAVVCQLNQELTDRAIPIYFREEEDKIHSSAMSVIYEQDKTGISAHPDYVGIQSAEPLHLRLPTACKRPYIAMVHCYARNGGLQKVNPNGERVSSLKKPSTNTKAPRYQLNFLGFKSYRGVDDNRAKRLQALLESSKNHVFTAHAKQEDYALHALRRQQPLLHSHQEARGWFEGDIELPEKKAKKAKKQRKEEAKVNLMDVDG